MANYPIDGALYQAEQERYREEELSVMRVCLCPVYHGRSLETLETFNGVE